MIVIENEALRVEVDDARGAELTYLGAPEGSNILACYAWEAPLRASRSSSYGSSLLDWLSEYRGGWQELFPNTGPGSAYAGVPLPPSGEVSMARWEIERASPLEVELKTPARLPLILQRKMSLHPRDPVLFIDERVHNPSEADLPVVWGHHPAFDLPPGALIDLPGRAVHVDASFAGDLVSPDKTTVDVCAGSVSAWPWAKGRGQEQVDLRVVPSGPCERLAYMPDVSGGWFALRDIKAQLGVALSWDLATFPHVWLWQEIGGRSFPWYGRGRITSVQPHSSWPAVGLAEAERAGRALTVRRHSSLATWLTVSLFRADARAVIDVDREGNVTQGEREQARM